LNDQNNTKKSKNYIENDLNENIEVIRNGKRKTNDLASKNAKKSKNHIENDDHHSESKSDSTNENYETDRNSTRKLKDLET
jgi:hypothetical protein